MIALESTSLWQFVEQAKRANCSRCGFCLAVCPTYKLTGLEVQSPRGRIALIDAVARGDLAPGPGFREHMYHCLFCQACETVCPSGVKIGRAVVTARAILEKEHEASLPQRLALRWLLPYPRRLELAATVLRLYQRLGLRRLVRRSGLMRGRLRQMEELLPPLPTRPLRRELPEVIAAKGPVRHRVGFFLGCFMSLVYADASRASIEVLTENGCEVVVPKAQRCCGAPHLADGDRTALEALARRNVDAFGEVDFIVSDCAACSATLKDYADVLSGDSAYAARAEAVSRKARDITEFLAGLPLRPPKGEVRRAVSYHAPCHLIHSQGISEAPRMLLRAVPGLELREMRESDWCCGSAGAYGLTHPERSAQLLERKMANVEAAGARVVATANPGCMLELRLGAERRGDGVEVMHVTQLLAESYRREREHP
ncbi:MAG: (Fe-S)-binding protein [Chloroflexi bacterium]|nr:(Fe-S)-binding protein [Chloroflexota bacterium]